MPQVFKEIPTKQRHLLHRETLKRELSIELWTPGAPVNLK
jgi:hypothetical protein